jgi:hypothetical protein
MKSTPKVLSKVVLIMVQYGRISVLPNNDLLHGIKEISPKA